MRLSHFIKNDLQSRLRSGQTLPMELTLKSLAGHYDVSLTPVRTAVEELIAEGDLQRLDNHRLARAVGTLPKGFSSQVSFAQQHGRDWLEMITNDLVRLSLNGKPTFVREEAAARRYQISRTVVRNIFNRLAGMGLLTHIPRRGWRLRPFRQEDMQSFLAIREVLELKALDLAASRLVDADLQDILERNTLPAHEDDWPQIDNSLHAYIIRKSGNPYISSFFERQGRYYEVLFAWEDFRRDVAIETVRQHREILEAMLARNWSAAQKALSWHIRGYHPVLCQAMTIEATALSDLWNEEGGEVDMHCVASVH